MNSVKLYSNGTAVISREYAFQDQEPLQVSIPVRKSDLDDVISSLSVFGNVTITVPPTYTPTNAHETELTLKPANVLKQLATKLAGATVEIEAGPRYTGKLMGLHQYRQEVQGTVVKQCRLIVLTEKGVQQIDETAVTAIRFTDALIQAEIDKALAASLSEIKPDSSLIEMTIQAKAGTSSAVVTYATPVAAWKIRYQLRLTSLETELEGQAIVDNDTDDDWTDTLITVITGEPITFSTDLAEIRRPQRSRVNIVANRATGAVTAAPEIMSSMPAAACSASASAPDEDEVSIDFTSIDSGRERAYQTQAEVRESGDFSIFQSPTPVTIRAKRSAIIPLFRTAIGHSQPVLFYNGQDDPQRPFRAIRLKNQANHPLGRGLCEVSVDGDFQGKCVLEPTKPEEEVLLVYAKETGVRIHKETNYPRASYVAIQLSEGTAYYEQLRRQQTVFQIQNSQHEAFALELEYPCRWSDSKLEVSVSVGPHEIVKIARGYRIRVTLEAKSTLSVNVSEDKVDEQKFYLSTEWLNDNLILRKHPAANDQGIQRCLALQKDVDTLLEEVDQQERTAKTLDEEQKRLMKLIPNGHNDQANEWRTDLATAEKELREIKRVSIPELKRKLQDAKNSLREGLCSLKFNWTGK